MCTGGNFAVNLDDARFSAVLTSPDFALDPTDPRYKQATAVVEGVKKRRGTKHSKQAAQAAAPTRPERAGPKQGDLQLMVAKLKKKKGGR